MSQLPNTDFPIVIDVWQDSLKPPLKLTFLPIFRIPFLPISTTLSLAIVNLSDRITPPIKPMKALVLFHTCPRKTKSNHTRSYFIGFNPYRSFHHMQMSIIEKYRQFYCLRKRKVMKVETKNRNYIANK